LHGLITRFGGEDRRIALLTIKITNDHPTQSALIDIVTEHHSGCRSNPRYQVHFSLSSHVAGIITA
jgi:hypothetical protein